MNKTIIARRTIFVVVQCISSNIGSIFDMNVKAFSTEENAKYYAEKMNERIRFIDPNASYHVEELELLELA